MSEYITEPSGARWIVRRTETDGDRTFWVHLVNGRSAAKPATVGFYAATITAARDALRRALEPQQ